jgi:hypothetical protein
MLRKILVIALVSLVASCGGGGDSSNASTEIAAAGIYEGTLTPTGGTADVVFFMITSDGKVALVDVTTNEGFIGTKTGNTLNGTIYSSVSVPATGEITTVSGNNISGTYTSSIGGGTYSLVANTNLYNRTSSLSKLEGTWVDSVFTSGTGTTTWVIQNDGAFIVSSTLGCNATGAFSVINTTKNEYNLTLNITTCIGFNGSYTGIAALSDTFNTDDSISLVFNSGSIAGLAEPVKQ